MRDFTNTSVAAGLKFDEFAGLPELRHDERFMTGRERIKHSDELYGLLDDIVKTRKTSEWLDFCAENSIPASEIVDLENRALGSNDSVLEGVT